MTGALGTTGPEAAIAQLVEAFRPFAIPCSPLQELVQDAARQAGWRPPAATETRLKQQIAGHERARQRQELMGFRRVFVAIAFRNLSNSRKKYYNSTRTAQAIIAALQELKLDPEEIPMTERTIQEDLKAMRRNGNFGI
jgi:hypothetical protein